MTRPRESILNLFDPLNLNDPSTPKRVSESPDSDKENSVSNEPGEVTVFFNKTYSRRMVFWPVHVKPTKRLVDIGDVTAVLDEETGMGLGMVREEDEDDVQEEEDRKKISLNDSKVENTLRPEAIPPMSPDDTETPMQRTPFTDITPEATPIARKTYRRDETSSVIVSATRTSPGVARAPPGSPLASIINAINFSHTDTDTNTAYEHENDEQHGHVPRISVSPSSDSSLALASSTARLVPSPMSALLTQTIDPPSAPVPNPKPTPSSTTLACSTAHLVPSTTSALLTNIPLSLLPLAESMSESVSGPPPRIPPSPSRSPPKFASAPSLPRSRPPSRTKSNKQTDTITNGPNPNHTRLISIDIDMDSFNMRLQNPESSFDLLNDRVSFFDLDNSLSARMNASVAEPGTGIGTESSFIDRAAGSGIDMSVGGVTMADFDMKDEEGRMRAFLGMSGDWEEQGQPEDTKLARETGSQDRVVENSPTSMHSTPQSKPKPNPKSCIETEMTPCSAECTPKPVVMETATGMPKKPLSSLQYSTPSLTNTNQAEDRLAVDSPPKSRNISIKPTSPRRSLASTSPPPRSQSRTRTPSKVAYVAPPLVPALRIVKRTNVNAKVQTHNRASSTSSAAASTSATTTAHPSTSAPRPPLPPLPAHKPAHKPTLQGVQRPRPSKAATVAGPPKSMPGFGTKMTKPSEVSASGAAAVNSESKLVRPASVISSAKTVNATIGAPRNLPTTSSSNRLREPSRFRYGGTASSTGDAVFSKRSSATVTATMTSRLPAGALGSTRMTSKAASSIPAPSMSKRRV